MEDCANMAIRSALQGLRVFCKFLSANDAGQTGGHQKGIYVSRPSAPILFDQPGIKGQNKEKRVKIRWMDGNETNSRFICYGQGTRNEYRITNFGRGFPYLRPNCAGALFVLVQDSSENYQAFVLDAEDEINWFLDAFAMSPTETGRLIDVRNAAPATLEQNEFERFLGRVGVGFPTSDAMSEAARKICNAVYMHAESVFSNPDRALLEWMNLEYKLFRALERVRYGDRISQGFDSVEEFIETATQIINRRKSRAGKSLEHHLSAIFKSHRLIFEEQAVTEGNKRPDFLFPSQEAYRLGSYPTDRLITLAAKTTCKDRWRQVINEADRLRGRPKYLCTLQQGISAAQMDEMESELVILVVPQPYISSFPKDRQNRIWSLSRFVDYVKKIEGL